MASNIFDKETKWGGKKRLKNVLDAGHFSSFRPFVYKIITKEGKKTTNKQKIKSLFTVHIFTLRHFCWGERQLIWYNTPPPHFDTQINRFTMIHYSAILSLCYLQWMNKYSYRHRLNHTSTWTFKCILKGKFTSFLFFSKFVSKQSSPVHAHLNRVFGLLILTVRRNLPRASSVHAVWDKVLVLAEPKLLQLNAKIGCHPILSSFL